MTTDRIDLVVALSIKNMQHPNRNSFPAFVRNILTVKCQVSPQVIQGEINALRTAWCTDKWASIIWGNPYNITREEIDKWEHDYKHVSCII
jgi:hypothetical protein